MIPSLFTFTILAAVVLLVVGLPFAFIPGLLEKSIRAFPRNIVMGWITMLIGGGWFLWKISLLAQADFGDYKNYLLILFGVTLLASLFYVRDFLAVRGLAIIVLLSANTGLKSAFGLYDIPSRLVLVSFLYLFIVAAIVYGIMPYKMRDTVSWLYAKSARARVLGIVLSGMGIALLACVFNY